MHNKFISWGNWRNPANVRSRQPQLETSGEGISNDFVVGLVGQRQVCFSKRVPVTRAAAEADGRVLLLELIALTSS